MMELRGRLSPAPPPVAPDHDGLMFRPGRCGVPCGLVEGAWSGLPLWKCPDCGFETFERIEAEAKLAALKVFSPEGTPIVGTQAA